MNVWDIIILVGIVGLAVFIWLRARKRGSRCDGCCSACHAAREKCAGPKDGDAQRRS